MHSRLAAYFLVIIFFVTSRCTYLNDICGINNGKRFYLQYKETGSLGADFKRNLWNEKNKNFSSTSNKCTVEFITCPSCIVNIKFRYLNISRKCGKASIFDTCGCGYVWIYEPPVEDASGEQFCGKFVQKNGSELIYISQTNTVALAFIYNSEYGQAFTLEYSSKRNRVQFDGYPQIGNTNNASQYISSPFFPYLYPIDLSVEYVINCETLNLCRISLIFTDFLIADSSIIEFFDWNGQRMYVTSGNVFRPPAIISTGPSLVVRFYANGASNLGFKASYSFILGNLNELTFTPNIGCGGFVNNLGGAITMMNMVKKDPKFFDCVWIIKPPEVFQHRKTHIYVKVANFTDFAGTTEMVIRQGLTSTQSAVETLKYSMAHFPGAKPTEHVAPITQGFYIRLRGHFGPQSQLAIVFAAFNYKDCFSGSDFLCHNLRCISILLNCDGFDHCGDHSDESADCSLDPKDHREFSKIPNFLFPKTAPYSDIATATFVFLTCSFGLIGIILAMALLLYRVNVRTGQQRHIQDHIETIHAILEEGIGDVEEELIVPDEPPDYEAPPDYADVLKLKYIKKIEVIKIHNRCSSQNSVSKNIDSLSDMKPYKSSSTTEVSVPSVSGTGKSCQSTTIKVPDSPPPAYENLRNRDSQENVFQYSTISSPLVNRGNHVPVAGPSSISLELSDSGRVGDSGPRSHFKIIGYEERATRYLAAVPKNPSQIFSEIRRSFRYCKSVNFLKEAQKMISSSEENLVRYISDSELIFHSNLCCKVERRTSKLKKSFSTDDVSLL